jgi:hypothetical protein
VVTGNVGSTACAAGRHNNAGRRNNITTTNFRCATTDNGLRWRNLRIRDRSALLLRRDRKLQHSQSLICDKPRYQEDLSVGKLERVMMRVRIGGVDLPEAGDLFAHRALPEPGQRMLMASARILPSLISATELAMAAQAIGVKPPSRD